MALAQPGGEVEPAAADRREARLAPAAIHASNRGGQASSTASDARPSAPAVLGEEVAGRAARRESVRQFTPMPSTTSLDAAAGALRPPAGCRTTLAPSISTSFGHLQPSRRPGGRRLARSRPAASGGDEGELGRLGRRHVGGRSRSERRDCRRRAPVPAAAAAPAGSASAATQTRRALAAPRRARRASALVQSMLSRATSEKKGGQLRTAIRTQSAEGERPPPRRPRRAGPGRTKNSRMTSAATAMMRRHFPARRRVDASFGSSKYITLMMRR